VTRWTDEGWGSDPQAPMRGIAWGIVISVALWALVLVPLLWFTHVFGLVG
jgi:hypothetical protein